MDRETADRRTAIKVMLLTFAIIGVLWFFHGVAMAEPKRVITDEQRQALMDKKDAKDNLKNYKEADIDACKNLEDCKPVIKAMFKAVKATQ
ncbi:MAG: hypothetical protein HQK97_07550 [Nitrospirae bacterium]|nr:hypothetical protein [Nitrospirota bacterium]